MANQGIVVVDSRDRQSGSATAFTVALAKTFANVRTIQLFSCEIPTPFNVRTKKASGITVSWGSSSAPLAIAPGFYTSDTLCAALLSALQGSAFTGLGATAVTYSTNTSLLTFSFGGNLTQNVVFTAVADGTLNRVVGVPHNAPVTSVIAASVSNTLTMPYVLDLHPERVLYLVCSAGIDCTNTSGLSAMCRIQHSAPDNSTIYGNNANLSNNKIDYGNSPQTIAQLVISLVYGDGMAVELNGLDWTASFGISYDG